MAIIRKIDGKTVVETAKKQPEQPAKKKESGLGRGLQSLLEDNSPDIGRRSSVVRRSDDEKSNRSSDDLYRKDGVLNVQKSKRFRY